MQTMICKNCNRTMVYNQRYECYNCPCGKTYNALGQPLRPLKEWKEAYDSEND